MYGTVQVWRSEDNLRSILSSSSTVGSGHETQVISLVGQVPLAAKPSHLSKPLWPILQWQMTSIKLFLVIWSLLPLETYAFICYSGTSQPLCWAHDAHCHLDWGVSSPSSNWAPISCTFQLYGLPCGPQLCRIQLPCHDPCHSLCQDRMFWDVLLVSPTPDWQGFFS